MNAYSHLCIAHCVPLCYSMHCASATDSTAAPRRCCTVLVCQLIKVQTVLYRLFPLGIPRLSSFQAHLRQSPYHGMLWKPPHKQAQLLRGSKPLCWGLYHQFAHKSRHSIQIKLTFWLLQRLAG